MPVTGIWVAGPVLAWAVRYGRRAGAITALILSGCDFLLRSEAFPVVLNGVVLLLLAGVVVGHLARLAAEVETERRWWPRRSATRAASWPSRPGSTRSGISGRTCRPGPSSPSRPPPAWPSARAARRCAPPATPPSGGCAASCG